MTVGIIKCILIIRNKCMKFDYEIKYYDFFLLFLMIGLNICGILIVRSASNMDAATVSRQIIGSLAGVCACIIVSFIDYRKLIKYSALIFGVCLAFLVAVKLLGIVHKGAGRWINLPILGQVQPSEFCKVGIIIFFSGFFEKHRETVSSPKTFFKGALLFALPAALILAQPNLSTTIIITVIFSFMVFASGISFKWVFGVVGSFLALFAAVMYTFRTDLYEKLPLLPYQKQRILGFLYPEEYSNTFYQQENSMLAIGSGGLYGKGLYNTGIDSVKAGKFLIEEDTDFIFAIIGEELGFRGCVIILAAFLLIMILTLYHGGKSKDMAGKLICVGMASWLAFQTFTNIAVAMGLFPTTGVTLPFFSRGVSSLLSIYIGMGIVLNIGLQRKTK